VKTIAERLAEAQINVEKVEEEMSLLFSTLGIWDDIDDWEFNPETNEILIYSRTFDEPLFNEKVRAGLRAAGFSKLYFPDWGPLATVVLKAKE
jgi:hypothetical protein